MATMRPEFAFKTPTPLFGAGGVKEALLEVDCVVVAVVDGVIVEVPTVGDDSTGVVAPVVAGGADDGIVVAGASGGGVVEDDGTTGGVVSETGGVGVETTVEVVSEVVITEVVDVSVVGTEAVEVTVAGGGGGGTTEVLLPQKVTVSVTVITEGCASIAVVRVISSISWLGL